MENRFLKLQAIRATLITFSFVSSAIGALLAVVGLLAARAGPRAPGLARGGELQQLAQCGCTRPV